MRIFSNVIFIFSSCQTIRFFIFLVPMTLPFFSLLMSLVSQKVRTSYYCTNLYSIYHSFPLLAGPLVRKSFYQAVLSPLEPWFPPTLICYPSWYTGLVWYLWPSPLLMNISLWSFSWLALDLEWNQD